MSTYTTTGMPNHAQTPTSQEEDKIEAAYRPQILRVRVIKPGWVLDLGPPTFLEPVRMVGCANLANYSHDKAGELNFHIIRRWVVLPAYPDLTDSIRTRHYGIVQTMCRNWER